MLSRIRSNDRLDSPQGELVSQPSGAYEALGGHPGIRRAVDGFHDRLTSDPRLAGYFADIDGDVLRGHQVDLLAAVAGGPQRYTGRDLASAHTGLLISDADYNRVMGHLNAALVEAGVGDRTIRTVLSAVEGFRSEVVGV